MDQRIRKRIWFEIEETQRKIRYCSPLKDRYTLKKSELHRRQFLFSALLLVVTPLIAWLNDNIALFTVLIGLQLSSVIGLCYNFMAAKYRKLNEIVAVLEKVLEKLEEISTEMMDLWDNSEMGKVSSDSASLIIRQMVKRREMLDSLVAGYDLTRDDELNRKSTEEAKQYMEVTVAKVHYTLTK